MQQVSPVFRQVTRYASQVWRPGACHLPIKRILIPPITRALKPQWYALRHLSSSETRQDKKSGSAHDDFSSDIKKKIDDAQARIDETIASRAQNTSTTSSHSSQDETIVHTVPESSSIVETSNLPGDAAVRAAQENARASKLSDSSTTVGLNSSGNRDDDDHDKSKEMSSSPKNYSQALPSQVKEKYSAVRQHFLHFMDNFQSHVFVASRRLNDLTGYTGIETLKKNIEDQEIFVKDARQHVQDCRATYQAAIGNRSNTQREVNDLLHRKHTWTPDDVDRFTTLYRSDHANEQAEEKAHTALSQAETQYEEASTKLAKSILARYHEEQIWSDKIRQMSTWGTWGLMGLNVLLFVVFQILIEPWRRRRLVKGFEEKVQAALQERDMDDRVVIDALHSERRARSSAEEIAAAASITALEAESAGPSLFPRSLDDSSGNEIPSKSVAQRMEIEAAAEALTNQEVLREADIDGQSDQLGSEPAIMEVDLLPVSNKTWRALPDTALTNFKTRLAHYKDSAGAMFDENSEVMVSQRKLTTSMLEGVFIGVAGTALVFWLAGVGIITSR